MEMDITIPKGRGFTPFPFGQCAVCGAEATGNHYGANTCEGCKGFFKRSLPVFRSFRCFFGNKCDVSPDTRNRCKACRFRKCIEAGMALDAVKMGRIPKIVKEQALEQGAASQPSRQISSSSQNSLASPPAPLSNGSHGRDSHEGSYGSHEVSAELDSTSYYRSADVESSQMQQQPGVAGPSRRLSQSNSRYNPYQYGNASEIDNSKNDYRTEQAELDYLPYQRHGFHSSEPASQTTDSGHRHPAECHPTSIIQRAWPAHSDQSDKGQSTHSVSYNSKSESIAWPTAVPSRSSSVCDSVKKPHQLNYTVTDRNRAIADMAITGDFNENYPDVKNEGSEMKARMVTDVTAVAVMEPKLSGGKECVPVVPRDVIVFMPSYVPPDQVPETAYSKLNSHYRYRLTDGLSRFSDLKMPTIPTTKFFSQLATNPEMKSAICEHTFRMIAMKNNEVYGEETRANELFLKECLSSGNIPLQPERSPQAMRDILKERLITQVKRVVQLSESIPGFRTMDTDDQHSLLRTCILDVWMVHSARFLRDHQSYILFLETNTFYARYWMEMFLTDEFLETVFEIASRINSLDLSFDELALLKSILIVRPDRPGLRNVEFIAILHNHLLDSLKLGIRSRRSVESVQLLDDLMDLLKGWRILDIMQEKYVHPIDLSHFSQGPWKIGESPSPVTSIGLAPSVCSSPPASVNGLNANSHPLHS